MITLEQRTKVFAMDCNGTMYDEIVKNEKEALKWCDNHSLELFSTQDIQFKNLCVGGYTFEEDYKELLSIMEDKTRCFDELSEAQENFMQVYMYFDGAKLEKYYTRFYN